jgi:NADH:ubiquinone oxidoreductase subunit C
MLGIPYQEHVLQISSRQLLPAVEKILELGVWHLSTITCLQDEHFTLLYHFWCFGNLTLRIDLAEEDLQVQSICALIPGAEYYEREVREMYGVEFRGLPNPAPLLLPDNWRGGYPMRKEEQDNIPEVEKKDSNALQGGTS